MSVVKRNQDLSGLTGLERLTSVQTDFSLSTM